MCIRDRERVRSGFEINPVAAYGYEDARVLPVVGVSTAPSGYLHPHRAQTWLSFALLAYLTSPFRPPGTMLASAGHSLLPGV